MQNIPECIDLYNAVDYINKWIDCQCLNVMLNHAQCLSQEIPDRCLDLFKAVDYIYNWRECQCLNFMLTTLTVFNRMPCKTDNLISAKQSITPQNTNCPYTYVD